MDSPVRKAGLSLVSIETKVVPCPYREKWLKNGGDPKAHARWFIPTTRTWSNATFTSGKTSFFMLWSFTYVSRMTRLPKYRKRTLIDGGKLLYSMVTNLTGFKTFPQASLNLALQKRRTPLSINSSNFTKIWLPSIRKIMGWITFMPT